MKSVFAISTERPSSCSTRSCSSRRSVTSRIFSSCSSLTFDAGTGREKGGKKCHQWNLDLEDENWNVEIYIYTYIYISDVKNGIDVHEFPTVFSVIME